MVAERNGEKGWKIDIYSVESGKITANGCRDISMVSGREDISYGE
jgi:hypothetical protein